MEFKNNLKKIEYNAKLDFLIDCSNCWIILRFSEYIYLFKYIHDLSYIVITRENQELSCYHIH